MIERNQSRAREKVLTFFDHGRRISPDLQFVILTQAGDCSFETAEALFVVFKEENGFHSDHQHSFPFRNAYGRAGAGIEFEKVFFNAVAEDDAVFGHLGFENQRRLVCDTAEDQ